MSHIIRINSKDLNLLKDKCLFYGKMEEWKSCILNDKYECSNTGIIRNKKTKRQLKYWICNGYYYTWLGSMKTEIGFKKIKSSVHRIIISSFLGIEYEKEIDHIDRNRLNNNLSNLRWVTKYENSINKNVKNYHKKIINGYTYYEICFAIEEKKYHKERFKTEIEAINKVNELRLLYRSNLYADYL